MDEEDGGKEGTSTLEGAVFEVVGGGSSCVESVDEEEEGGGGPYEE